MLLLHDTGGLRKLSRVILAPVVLVLCLFVLGGCCSFDARLYAQLGQARQDVSKLYGQSTVDTNQLQAVRMEIANVVDTAKADKGLWCPEPVKQAQAIQAMFETNAVLILSDHWREPMSSIHATNILEGLDIAIQTQERLK
jgi:hypothetical protein